MRIEGRIIVRVLHSRWTHPALNSMSVEGRVSTMNLATRCSYYAFLTHPSPYSLASPSPFAYRLTFLGIRRIHERGYG